MMSLVRDFRAVEERWEMFRCVVVSFCQVRASHVGSREVGGGVAGGDVWWGFPVMLRAAFLYWLLCSLPLLEAAFNSNKTVLNSTSVLATPDPHRQNWQMQLYPGRLTSLRLLL